MAGPNSSPRVGQLPTASPASRSPGNHALAKLYRLARSPAPVAGQLRVSSPGDVAEQEAERIADAVMRIPMERAPAESVAPPPILQPMCQHCADDEELHRKEKGAASRSTSETLADVLRSPGQPLDAQTRAFFEPRFGHDFADVRIHDDTSAAQSAEAVQAQAYTVGSHIVFGAAQHATDSAAGHHLMAHELTHVIQQSGGAAALPQRNPHVQREGLKNAGEGMEAIPISGTLTTNSASLLQRRVVCPPNVSEEDGTGCYEVPDETPVSPDQTTADPTAADQATPDQTTADPTAADQATPDQTTADPTAADQATPDQTTADPTAAVTAAFSIDPGSCTFAEHRALQDDVDKWCHGQKACTQNDDCATLWDKIGKFANCVRARTTINAKCFAGGNPGHVIALASAVGALGNCWAAYNSNKCKSDPNEAPAADSVEDQKTTPAFDQSFLEKMAAITGLTGAALIAYLIVSEGSRLFPPRNLIPVP